MTYSNTNIKVLFRKERKMKVSKWKFVSYLFYAFLFGVGSGYTWCYHHFNLL